MKVIMTKQIKFILKGVGSIVDICPPSNYNQFIPKGSPRERMNGSLVRIGAHLTNAVNRFANEQQKEKKS